MITNDKENLSHFQIGLPMFITSRSTNRAIGPPIAVCPKWLSLRKSVGPMPYVRFTLGILTSYLLTSLQLICYFMYIIKKVFFQIITI